MTPLDLSGRTALVTGGSRGIGFAVVRALAQAGARVTFTARSEASVATALMQLPAGVAGRVCDVTDHEEMARLLAPGIDILVNNAGIIGPIGFMEEAGVEDWSRNIAINLVGAFAAIRAALPGMMARGGGTVVNVSSGAARRPLEGWSAYCAGKAGLAMLTQSLHLEYGTRGIRAFGFAPGVVDTDMQAAIRASGLNRVSQIPRESLASPEEPAWSIAWLATRAADPLVGQELDIRSEGFRRAAGLPLG